jgi:hypothetical protein
MILNEIALPYHQETAATKIAKSFDKFINVPVTPKQVVSHLRKIAGTSTVITTSKSDVVDANSINLNAYYDPDEDEEDEKPFELALVFNPKDKEIKMDRAGWREFASQVIDYLEHEMIHQYQYRSRDFHPNREFRSKAKDPETKKQQEYLGNSDEIEAYAYNLANELLRKTKSDYDMTLRLLSNFSRTAITKDQAGRFLSPNLYGYFKDFNFDTTHPVLKRLMKKTYQYVNLLKKNRDKKSRIDKRNSEIEKSAKEFKQRKETLDKQQGSSYTAIIGN